MDEDKKDHAVAHVEPADTPDTAQAVLDQARRDHNAADPATPTGLDGAGIGHPDQQPDGEEDEANA